MKCGSRTLFHQTPFRTPLLKRANIDTPFTTKNTKADYQVSRLSLFAFFNAPVKSHRDLAGTG